MRVIRNRCFEGETLTIGPEDTRIEYSYFERVKIVEVGEPKVEVEGNCFYDCELPARWSEGAFCLVPGGGIRPHGNRVK